LPDRIAELRAIDVAEAFRDLPGLVLLESARPGRNARWTYLTADPIAVLESPAAGPDPFTVARRLLGRLERTAIIPAGAPPFLGVIGGTAEWIFSFHDRISVTVSGADAIVDQDREALAVRIWADVAQALGITAPMPAWQIVKEKRATFAATPEQAARRPAAKTRWRNLFLAGDWTQTGLPATIEGALRSGETAAALALRHLSL